VKKACAIAGLNTDIHTWADEYDGAPRRLTSTGFRAAVASGADKQLFNTDEPPRHVLVYDLGRASFTATVMHNGYVHGAFEEAGVIVDDHLGGDDFDNRTTEWLASQYAVKTGKDCRGNETLLSLLRQEAERSGRCRRNARQ
jgi:molecular chaperone DnaK (HSP70)